MSNPIKGNAIQMELFQDSNTNTSIPDEKNTFDGLDLLSQCVSFSKYAKYIPDELRRETWDEVADRLCDMFVQKYPQLEDDIRKACQYVRRGEVFSSMRALQFAGPAIDLSPVRIMNCFSGDETFVSDRGIVPFASVVGQTLRVRNIEGDWAEATVQHFGRQQLNRIVFKHYTGGKHGNAKHVVRATANHRWVLEDGTVTTRLKVGDILASPDLRIAREDMNEEAIRHGLVYGDGELQRHGNGKEYVRIRLCGPKAQHLDLFDGYQVSRYDSHNGDPSVWLGDTGVSWKHLPNTVDPAYIAGFIHGLWLADGWHDKENVYRIGTQDRALADWLAINGPIAGLKVTSEQVYDKDTNFGSRSNPLIAVTLASGAQARLRVDEIHLDQVEDVYCVVEPKTKTFMLGNGQITGNCAFMHMNDRRAFREFLFLLLSGCGVGYSVQEHHVAQLPAVVAVDDTRVRRFSISDDIIGWANALDFLMKSYMPEDGKPQPRPVFDYRDIRPKGARLKTSGGLAPGPEGLRESLEKIEGILREAVAMGPIVDGVPQRQPVRVFKPGDYRYVEGSLSRKLRPFEVHRINCITCEAVLSGGIRRSSALCLFSKDDLEMRDCKQGYWWQTYPELGRCNNSMVLLRDELSWEFWVEHWQTVKDYGTGEPGVFITNNLEWGTNACAEASLPPGTFCNLTNIPIPNRPMTDEEKRGLIWAATLLGTLQAGFTDFHYLRSFWKETTEKHALLGVSFTGAANHYFREWDLPALAEYAKEVNAQYADLIGINHSSRIGLLKPSGNSSCVAKSSSGLSRWHAPFFIRRMQINKTESLYGYVAEKLPGLVEDYWEKPDTTAVLSIPIRTPQGGITDDQSSLQEMLDDIERVYRDWIVPTHRWGDNTHSVSVTVRLRPEEWEQMWTWFWNNRDVVNCISLMPFDGGTYRQAPFETIDEARYNELVKNFEGVDFSLAEIVELEDGTSKSDTVACGGGSCEVSFL